MMLDLTFVQDMTEIVLGVNLVIAIRLYIKFKAGLKGDKE